MTPGPADRRIDLDWLRICAFLVLILHHVGMYDATWDWHVKSAFVSRSLGVVPRLPLGRRCGAACR